MLTLSLRGGAVAALAAMPERVRAALAAKANALAASLEAEVRRKLTGDVLNTRTGALVRSIVATVEQTPTTVSAKVTTSGNLKYAAILEFGGTIPPHQIVPNKARSLAFAIGGKEIVAAHANLPAVAVPERSYLRSSLAEMADAIREGFGEALTEASR